MSKYEFNNLFIDLNVEPKTASEFFTQINLVNELYHSVHSYEQFNNFCYAKHAFKVVAKRRKVRGYNLKGELIWTIKWKSHMKNS